MKKIGLVGALCACLFTATANAETLRVGCESTYPPFEFFDTKSGQVTGYDVDLMAAIAKRIGAKVETVQMGFDAIIPSIMTGTVDVGASAFTITAERAKKVLFSDPYYLSGLSILIRKKDMDKIKSYDDLKNRTICVQIGTSGAILAAKVPGGTVKTYNTVNETYLELENRGCEAVIGDKPVIGHFMVSRTRNEKVFHHISQTLQSEEFGFAVNKNNTKLMARINKAMADMKADGEYDRIYRKWFGN